MHDTSFAWIQILTYLCKAGITLDKIDITIDNILIPCVTKSPKTVKLTNQIVYICQMDSNYLRCLSRVYYRSIYGND